MIHYAQLNLVFWAEVVDNIVYTLNRTCSRLNPHITPFEAYTEIKPSLAHKKNSAARYILTYLTNCVRS